MKTLITLWILTAAYVLIGIVTFGHAAAASAADYRQRCAKVPVLERDADCIAVAPLDGGAAAVLWPFYWSWEFWDEKPQP